MKKWYFMYDWILQNTFYLCELHYLSVDKWGYKLKLIEEELARNKTCKRCEEEKEIHATQVHRRSLANT